MAGEAARCRAHHQPQERWFENWVRPVPGGGIARRPRDPGLDGAVLPKPCDPLLLAAALDRAAAPAPAHPGPRP